MMRSLTTMLVFAGIVGALCVMGLMDVEDDVALDDPPLLTTVAMPARVMLHAITVARARDADS